MSTNDSVIIVPPTELGDVVLEVGEIADDAVGKILESKRVDIVGVNASIFLAATAAMLAMKGKKIKIEQICISEPSVATGRSAELIGIDLRSGVGKKSDWISSGKPKSRYIGVKTTMGIGWIISEGCNYLDKKGYVDLLGSGTAMNKVVHVAFAIPKISKVDVGIEWIKLGTAYSPEVGTSTQLWIRLSKKAAGKTSKDMDDYFTPYINKIKKLI